MEAKHFKMEAEHFKIEMEHFKLKWSTPKRKSRIETSKRCVSI